jgi:arsenate reductase
MTSTAPTAVAAIIDDLSYAYDGVFDKEAVTDAVTSAWDLLSPRSSVRTYLPILVARQAREQLMAQAQADGRVAKKVPELLFVCVHNAGRSQLAAALAEHLSARGSTCAPPARPLSTSINPVVVQVLAERGVTLGTAYPKPLSDSAVRAADVIITMGCGDTCPYLPREALRGLGRRRSRRASRSSRP